MLQIHPNARTTPVTRAEIACSRERTGVLAQRYGVSTETIRKWRKRGAADCLDHSARPHQLPWKATEEERAVVCQYMCHTEGKCVGCFVLVCFGFGFGFVFFVVLLFCVCAVVVVFSVCLFFVCFVCCVRLRSPALANALVC